MPWGGEEERPVMGSGSSEREAPSAAFGDAWLRRLNGS